MEDTTLIAYEMNGEPLPHWNGFPARVVVPGWTGVYWMKHVTSISARTKPRSRILDALGVPRSAGQVPRGGALYVTGNRGQHSDHRDGGELADHVAEQGAQIKAGGTVQVSGIAWDGGYGISAVEVSSDGGKTWSPATLGEDLGRYAFRTFSFSLPAREKASTR